MAPWERVEEAPPRTARAQGRGPRLPRSVLDQRPGLTTPGQTAHAPPEQKAKGLIVLLLKPNPFVVKVFF